MIQQLFSGIGRHLLAPTRMFFIDDSGGCDCDCGGCDSGGCSDSGSCSDSGNCSDVGDSCSGNGGKNAASAIDCCGDSSGLDDLSDSSSCGSNNNNNASSVVPPPSRRRKPEQKRPEDLDDGDLDLIGGDDGDGD